MKNMQMKTWSGLIVILLLIFFDHSFAQQKIQYKPNWKSLSHHQEVPEWIRDAKFGVYVHWGVYSVPAYGNEKYMKHMYKDTGFSIFGTYKRHLEIYGPLSKFGYEDFIPMFKAQNFNADKWAALFKEAGARFAGLVGEHHDGFSMWASKLTPFNAKDMGPHRDVVGELEKAIRQRHMYFFISMHHSHNYDYIPHIKPSWTAADPKYQKLYGSTMPRDQWLKMWLGKCNEVVDLYHPDIMYFDAWLKDIPDSLVEQYLAHYFNTSEKRGQQVAVTYKNHDLPSGVGMLDYENSNPDSIMDQPFLCDYPIGTGQSYSWGYTADMKIRSAKDIVQTLIRAVSKNGQMLLNLSPKADGTIPENQRHVVLRVGRWLWTYGESIYGTRPFSSFGEKTSSGIEVYYTQKKKTHKLYAIFLGWPGANTSVLLNKLTSESMPGRIKKITLLGFKENSNCLFKMTKKGLMIHIPQARLPDDIAVVFKIETE